MWKQTDNNIYIVETDVNRFQNNGIRKILMLPYAVLVDAEDVPFGIDAVKGSRGKTSLSECQS